MKITGLIPARLDSVRLPGKALLPLGGEPMVCRVLRQAGESGILDQVMAVTDSREIAGVCRSAGYEAMMTPAGIANPTARIAAAAREVESDIYVMIGGDEPLVTPAMIRTLVKEARKGYDDRIRWPGETLSVYNAVEKITAPEEAKDPANIKMVADLDGRALYASRGLIPASESAEHDKFVSIGAYSREALEYFTGRTPGPLEQAEHFDLLRFMEGGWPVRLVRVSGWSLSVDTAADYQRVCRLIEEGRG